MVFALILRSKTFIFNVPLYIKNPQIKIIFNKNQIIINVPDYLLYTEKVVYKPS